MVTKQEESTSTQEPQPTEEGDSLIEDSTPQHVLEQEVEFDAKTAELQGEEAADETEAGAPEGAEEPAETPAAEQQPAVEPEPPAVEPQPEVKPERTYQQEEWDKRQSSWDRQQAEIERQLGDLRQRDAERSVETEVEARVRVLEGQLTPNLGAEEASRFARDPSRVAEIKQGLQAEQQLKLAQEQIQQGQQTTASTWINSFIVQEKARLNLTDAQATRLQQMAMSVPFDLSTQQGQSAYVQFGENIGQMAEELSAASTAQQELRKAQEAKVPAGTPETRLETGESEITPDSDDARADRIMATTNWNQLSAEDKAWFQRRVGADQF